MDNTATFKPFLKTSKKDPLQGTIYIRKTVNRKNTSVTLKENIPVKFWNSKTTQVRKTDKLDYKRINKKIKDKITDLEELHNTGKTDINKESFTDYFKQYIDLIPNIGSRTKYKQVYNKLTKHKEQILFTDIDITFLKRFHFFLLETQKLNTANHYIKLVRIVFNAYRREHPTVKLEDPFFYMSYKYIDILREALDKEEIEKLLRYNATSIKLEHIKNVFIFQIFSNGMRVSDVTFLKFENVKEDVIKYKMLKTGKNMSVSITYILTDIIYKQALKRLGQIDLNKKEYEGVKTRLDKIKELEKTLKNTIPDLGKAKSTEELYNLIKQKNGKNFFELIGENEEDLKELKEEFVKYISVKQTLKNYYIFDFVDFKVKNKHKLTDLEYKKYKSKVIVYNRLLKIIQKDLELQKTLKTHLARSTYATLLQDKNTNMKDIQNILGHSKLAITDSYLQGLPKTGTEDITQVVASDFLGSIKNEFEN